MPTTAERLSKLVDDSFDLDHEPRFDTAFRDLDINSMDAVRFFKLVNDEFDLGLGTSRLPAIQESEAIWRVSSTHGLAKQS